MTVLAPNEKLTGTPQQKREISERLVRFRQHPDRTLTLSETPATLTFQTLDIVRPGFGDREVFALGVRLARERLAELGLSELLPHERVFVGVTSTQPAWGGFHCPNPVRGGLPPGYRYVQAAAVVTRYGDLHGDVPSAPGVAGLDLIRTYTHDCFHWGTFRSYRLGNTGIHRNQHGINFRRENGSSYSAPDPQGSASTRNLGIIMEGAFDREATAVARDVAATAGIPCPTTGVDHYAWRDSTGDTLHVAFTPGTTWPINGHPPGSSQALIHTRFRCHFTDNDESTTIPQSEGPTVLHLPRSITLSYSPTSSSLSRSWRTIK